MKKTPVVPGKPVVMKTREDEEQLLMDWINLQSTYSDSIRYLIQKEIAENGLRNLQNFIPQFRSIESLKPQITTMPAPPPTVHNPTAQQAPALLIATAPERVVLDGSPGTVLYSENPTNIQQDGTRGLKMNAEQSQSTTETKTTKATEASSNPVDPVMPAREQTDGESAQGPATRRPAGKKFSSDVTSSFAN